MDCKLRLTIFIGLLTSGLGIIAASPCDNSNFANILSKQSGKTGCTGQTLQSAMNCFQNTCLQGANLSTTTLTNAQATCLAQNCSAGCQLASGQDVANFTSAYNAQVKLCSTSYQGRHAAEQNFLNYIKANSKTRNANNTTDALNLALLLSYAAFNNPVDAFAMGGYNIYNAGNLDQISALFYAIYYYYNVNSI